MRIIQIIDSLEAGGAERMAVNYANALASKIAFSGIIATRKEGVLKEQISDKTVYFFLNRKHTLDISSVFSLKSFVKKNKVTIAHAHGTSFFIAFLLKLIYPKIKIIWHDHYGDSEFLSKRPSLVLKISIALFSGVIVVNQKLKLWVIKKLNYKKTLYLSNFILTESTGIATTFLKGQKNKRIICLANLREQKGHFFLLEIAQRLKQNNADWSFHLVGKDFEDVYSKKIKELIIEYNLQNHVFIYGSRQDIGNILKQSDIAILTSKSEGLPLAILEYGQYKKAVVVTNVGEIENVIDDMKTGILVPYNNVDFFTESLIKLIHNNELAKTLGNNLYKSVLENFSEEAIINQYLSWLKTL